MNAPETKEVSIAVMARDIQYIKESILKIDQRLELMDGHYIKRVEVQQMKEEADKIHEANSRAIRALELDYATFKSQVKTWGSIAIIAVGVIEFIISRFF